MKSAQKSAQRSSRWRSEISTSHLLQALSLLIFGFGINLVPLAYSQTVEYKPLVVDAKMLQSIQIRGVEGSVTVRHKAGETLTVRIRQKGAVSSGKSQLTGTADAGSDSQKKINEDWVAAVQSKGSRLEVQVRGPQLKQEWTAKSLAKTPEFTIEIEGPSLPLDIGWRGGTVGIQSWSAPIHVSLIQGKIQISKGVGDSSLMLVDGQVSIDARGGRTTLQVYRAKTTIDSLKGDLVAHHFSGELKLSKIQGTSYISSHQGAVQMTGVRGRVEFEFDKSSLKIENLLGELKGRSSSGSVQAEIQGEAEVRIITESAPVTIQAIDSGAFLQLSSRDGGITVPPHLNVVRGSNGSQVTGRLKGRTSGQVFVESLSGLVRVR